MLYTFLVVSIIVFLIVTVTILLPLLHQCHLPKPHTFLSLPLQSGLTPELVSEIVNLSSEWNELWPKYLEAVTQTKKFAAEYGINVTRLHTGNSGMGTDGKMYPEMVTKLDMSNLSNQENPADLKSSFGELLGKHGDLRDQSLTCIQKATRLFEQTQAQLGKIPKDSEYTTEQEMLYQIPKKFNSLPKWPPTTNSP